MKTAQSSFGEQLHLFSTKIRHFALSLDEQFFVFVVRETPFVRVEQPFYFFHVYGVVPEP